jgi:hypothetical protein
MRPFIARRTTGGIYSSAGSASSACEFAVGAHRSGSRALAAGVTWTSRTSSAPWAGRDAHSSVIDAVSGAIYVIGGYGFNGGDSLYRDVWVSTDGGA